MFPLIELSVLGSYILWSIDQSKKTNATASKNYSELQDLKHSISDVSKALGHHIETNEIRIGTMSVIVDKIWSKIE